MKNENANKFEKAMGLLKEVFEEAQNSSENEKAPQSDLISFREAMERFGVSRNTMYRMERDGLVKVHRVTPRKLFVSLSQMEEAFKKC